MERYYAEFGWSKDGERWSRTPTFESLEDLKEYLKNIEMPEDKVKIYCDEM